MADHEGRYYQASSEDAGRSFRGRSFKVGCAAVSGPFLIVLAVLALAATSTISALPPAVKIQGAESEPTNLNGLAAGLQSQAHTLGAPPRFPRRGVVAAGLAQSRHAPGQVPTTQFSSYDAGLQTASEVFPPALRWGKSVSSLLPYGELERPRHVLRAMAPSVAAQEAAAKASKEAAEAAEAAENQEAVAEPGGEGAAGLSNLQTDIETVPRDHTELIAQCHRALEAAVKDGKTLLEVEFPEFDLTAKYPDDHASENPAAANFAKQLLPSHLAARGRVLFTDGDAHTRMTEVRGALPPPPFADDRYRTGFLCNNTPINRYNVYRGDTDKVFERCQPDDSAYVVAFSSFHIMELLAVQDLIDDLESKMPKESVPPIVWFNSAVDFVRYELDWTTFYSDYLTRMEPAYVMRIYDLGNHPPGVLFRSYPGPWQVLRRDSNNPDSLQLVHMSKHLLTNRQVLDFLNATANA